MKDRTEVLQSTVRLSHRYSVGEFPLRHSQQCEGILEAAGESFIPSWPRQSTNKTPRVKTRGWLRQ